MDRCVVGVIHKPLFLPSRGMARYCGRQRNKVPCCSTACRRRHMHAVTWQFCGERLGLRHSCSATVVTGQSHHHHHHHGHDHDHDHGRSSHHDHDHDHYPDNWATRVMRSVGLVQLASRIEHSGPLAVASILCFVVSLIAALPLVASLLSERVAATLQSAALCGTYLLSGLPQAVSSVALAAGGSLDTHVLMSLAVVATLYLGMAQEGALLLLLFQVSHFLESKFTSRAQGSLERLLAAMPERATLVAMTPTSAEAAAASTAPSDDRAGGGSFRESRRTEWRAKSDSIMHSNVGPDLSSSREVLAEDVAVGELVLVRPGEQVPLDGEVVWGVASVSAAHISGEAIPTRVTAGDWVPAGAVSADGALVVRVTAGAEDSTPARIARMASEAQASKPQLQRLLDRIGAVWSRGVVAATLVVGLSLLAAGVPLLAAPGGAVYRAVGVLVAGSPCAVVLVPLAYVCALATITRRGVLLKGASALDAMAACKTVALDKTGTLTTGELRLTEASLLDSTHFMSQPEVVAAEAAAPPSPERGRGRDLLPLLQRAAAAAAAAGGATSGGGSSSGVEYTSGSSSEGEGWEWWQSRLLEQGAAGREAEEWWGEVATRCAVALSRASSHPVSRAVAEAGPGLARGVSVAGLEQVPGSGVRGVCRLHGRSFHVTFGSKDFAEEALAEAVGATRSALPGPAKASGPAGEGEAAAGAAAEVAVARLRALLAGDAEGGESAAVKAVSLLVVTPLATPNSGSAIVSESGHWDVPRVALFCFEDVVRPGVREAVAALQDGSWRRRTHGSGAAALRVVMLTGDNPAVAAAVAEGLSIFDFRAAMLPQDKLRFVQQEQHLLQEQPRQRGEPGAWSLTAIFGGSKGIGGGGGSGGGAVLMMGDGINDAPALSAAHVGVAVASSPRDLVAAASDVIVLNGQGAAALPWLLRLAHRTQSVVRQNLTLALASMAFATLPTVAGFFPLWLAVLLHEGSTLLVALNSLRLLLSEESEVPVVGAGGAVPGSAAAAAAGAAATGFGPREALTEVWRGLCDIAASELHHQHQHHHNHQHHDHDHDHGHGGHSHGYGKTQARSCCSAGHTHSHDDDQDDEDDHGHHHTNSHHHQHNHDHDHEREDRRNSYEVKPAEQVVVAESPQGLGKPQQMEQQQDAQEVEVNGGVQDLARVRGSTGRDVSMSATARGLHARVYTCNDGGGAARSCCGAGCKHLHGGGLLGEFEAAGNTSGFGVGFVGVVGPLRRRHRSAGRRGPGVPVSFVAAATTAATAAVAVAVVTPGRDFGLKEI